MHTRSLKQISHTHHFGTSDRSNETKTLRVIFLTFGTMLVEISAGVLTGSMALLADGWHMGTHAFALGITWFAYIMARKYSHHERFSFGTGKFGVLAGYTSALFLGGTALYMLYESMIRFISPVQIAFNEAIIVAVVGLFVNVLSIWMLHTTGDHSHSHDHTHDHNLRAAYLHVVADALTSILAIVALIAGKYFGLVFLDPLMGIVGGLLIGKWAWGLLKSSGLILLDGSGDRELHKEITEAIQSDQDSIVADLHIWHMSSNDLAAIVSVVSREHRSPAEYYERLVFIKRLRHVTIEIHRCEDKLCSCAQDIS